MKIKVCGMREPENIRQLIELGPDYIGFIFYGPSKRFVGEISKEALNLTGEVKKTGVFVNATEEEILDKIQKYKLDAVQLHGSESPGMCKRLQQGGIEIIKAFGVDEIFDFGILNDYSEAVDYFLFDTKTMQHGGSGQVFDWNILKKYTLARPYFLSGGLDSENLHQVKSISDERLYAVDLNSRFEIEPGLKDIWKLEEAFEIIRS